MHHGPRVSLCMLVAGQRNCSQGFLLNTMIVHKAHHLHGKHLRWRHQPIGHRVRKVTPYGIAARALSKAPELPLGQCSKHHNCVCQPGMNRRCRIGHRAGSAAPAATPLHVGKAQFMTPQRRGKPRRVTAIIAV